jgi:alkyldihydroxyacetonephosphate synthase
VQWVFQGMRGELPSYGAAHVRLGSAHVLDAESRLPELLTQVQEQHIGLTSMTTLHARALAEVLDSTQEEVLEAFTGVGLTARPSNVSDRVQLNDASRWALALQAAAALRKSIPARWASWLVEPSVSTHSVLSTPVDEGDELGEATRGNSELDSDLDAMEEAEEKIRMMPAPEDVNKVIVKLCRCLSAVEEAAKAEAAVLRAAGVQQLTEEHLFRQLLKRQQSGVSLPPALARGAAHIVAAAWPTNLGEPGSENTISSSLSSPERDVVPLWPTMQATRDSNEPALERWGYKDTKFVGHWVDGVQAIKMTSTRYGKIGGRPLYRLWSFFQSEFSITMNVRNTLPERPLPQLPEPAEGLLKQLGDALPEDRIHTSLHSRLRAGTGHGLADIWRLRAGEVLRMPDAVVRPQTEQEVLQLLQKASAKGFAVIPVGGRTNVTSATVCPPREVDDRPFVAIDMTGLSSIKWVKKEDGVALVEAGITGTALKEALQSKGVNMGMEPDSMEFSTLGGWIATRASGMKRSRYGNIEDMVIEVRVVTPAGILWQHNGQMPDSAGVPATAFGRVSANVALPGLLLGSEGCLGIVVAAVVRVKSLPEVVEYESVIFPSWDNGARWMHEVAKLPAALRPASCRLMDNKQLSLARAVNEDPTKGQLRGLMQEAFLHLRGVSMKNAAAATIVFEGSKDEVSMQKRALRRLLRGSRGLWGGAASGEAGYAMTYAIAYIRDFGLDHQILSESLETMVPWSAIGKVWPAVVTALEAKHSQLRLPGRPFLSCRMTQLYDEGGVLYMYIATCTAGLSAEKALEAFLSLEHTARRVILQEGGCLSHHHGIGKHRCSHLEETQASITSTALRGLKVAMDPKNVLAARNGVWADVTVDM